MQICKKVVPLHSQNSNGVVAQLVEQRTENPCVTGSNPVDATKKRKAHNKMCAFFVYISFNIKTNTMSLETQINGDIKTAMLQKDKPALEALRAIKSAILLEKTSKNATDGELNEAAEIALLQKLVKQRKEAAEIYKGQDRADLYEAEMFQAGIIEKYLPKQLSREEIEVEVKNIIAQVGATTAKDMGKVMGAATKHFAGRADNKIVSEIVKSLLA